MQLDNLFHFIELLDLLRIACHTSQGEISPRECPSCTSAGHRLYNTRAFADGPMGASNDGL
jgi:hypothetical protein